MDNHLQEARKARGLTARALAAEIGVREDRIYSVERQRYNVRPDEARRWAAALGAPVARLFPGVTP